MKLLAARQEQVLSSLYGRAAAEEYSALLRNLSSILEDKVETESLALDQGRADIKNTRRILFEQGVCKLHHEPTHGGMGLPFGVYALAMELAGAADASTAMSLGIHGTVAEAVARFGSEGQKERLLPDLISGRRLAAFALTEPSSGSDARSMHTAAAKQGTGYVINGSKMFITNAGEADVYLVFASIGTGHGAFIVERDNPGLNVGQEIGEKLGMRGSRTAEIRFVDCRVEEDSVVGKAGEGFENAKALLDSSRIVMGMICVGIARAALERALAYSKGRVLFGKRLSEFQLTREKIADSVVDINAARLLCMHASRLKEAGRLTPSDAAQAKLLATEMAVRTCDAAIQLLGGYGYTSADVHRHWRDARLLTIGEGTSEVLRLIISAHELEPTG